MFRKKSDEELWRLEQELIAAEGEQLEEEDPEEDPEEADYEDCFEEEYEEEYDQEPFYRNHANGYGETVKNYANRYGRGSPRRFDDDDFFDESDFEDGDVLYRKDYKKAKRKNRRQNFGLLVLAILELAGIAAIILWWLSWTQ